MNKIVPSSDRGRFAKRAARQFLLVREEFKVFFRGVRDFCFLESYEGAAFVRGGTL